MKIAQMYAAGAEVLAICEKFDCSRNTVLRIARMNALPKRPKCFDPNIKAAVLAEIRAGEKLADIAKTFSVSLAYVSLVGKAAGLSRYKNSVSPSERDNAGGVSTEPII